MRNWTILFLMIAIASAWSCSGKKNRIEALTALEAELTAVQDVTSGVEAANAYLEKTREFVDKHPKASETPRYLFTSIGVARGLADFDLAIALAEETWTNYPDSEEAPEALFMQGFIYDSDLRDVENSRKYYNQFLSTYPDHPLAHNVKELLGVVEQDPQELIESFRQDSAAVEEEVVQ
jgi:outer membrane protein assembly factor BamD (BamD/ComL family)